MGDEKVAIFPLEAILIIIMTLVLSTFFASALFILFGYNLLLLIGELPILIIPLGYMVYKGVDVKKYVGLDIKPKHVLLGISLGAFLLLLNLVISLGLTWIFGPSESVEKVNVTAFEIAGSSLGGLSLMVAALSLAGICEEFAFRGFLQTSIGSKYPLGVALFVSSLAFALSHLILEPVYTLSIFSLGLALGYIYHRWRSYVVSAIAHAIMNLIVLAISLLVLS